MIATAELLSAGTPPFLLVDCDDVGLAGLYRGLLADHPAATVRLLRGARSRTETGFLDEAAAALQLPLHFGGGWNGFAECIRQYWLPTEAIVAIVSEGRHLLESEPASAWDAFVEVVGGAREAPGPPLRFVLQADPAAPDLVRSRIARAGGAVESLSLG